MKKKYYFLIFIIVIVFVKISLNDEDSLSGQVEDLIISNDSEILYNDLSEDEFKLLCDELDYNDIDDNIIGKPITKEILFGDFDGQKYTCGATEDYIEDLENYQNNYRIYRIYDKRKNNSFFIKDKDVIRIYGVITDVKTNYANGLEYPIIDMYYADYIRKWRESVDETKSIDEITEEREQEQSLVKAEQEYYASLNSDYNGISKNVLNMESLSEKEFKEKCDAMNFRKMADSTEDLTGRYIKIHIQLKSNKLFSDEEAKRKYLGDLVDIYNIDDNIWTGYLYNERGDNYTGELIYFYFANNNSYDIDSLAENDELVAYGRVIDYEMRDNLHNKFDFLIIYME